MAKMGQKPGILDPLNHWKLRSVPNGVANGRYI